MKNAHEYEDTKKLVSTLSQKLQETKKRFNAFDDGYRSLKQNRVYRVITNDASTKTFNSKENELVAIIADALLAEPYAVQLVARSTDNNLEMEKDWEMMSEFDKDEIIKKNSARVIRLCGNHCRSSGKVRQSSPITYHADKCKKSHDNADFRR